MRSSDFQSGQQRTMLIVAVIAVLALIGIGLLLVGFVLGNRQPDDQPLPTATSAMPVVQPPAGGAIVPTFTPLPTVTPPLPTDTPQPTSAPEPMIVAQEGGVNLRSGPGTTFSVVGRLEGGSSARVTGRYADWWQVDYGGTSAWVANWVVSDSDTAGVSEVVPPPSPIPPTSVPPTAIPPTSAPTAIPATAMPDTRGLRADTFVVGNKNGDSVKPNTTFGNAGDVWFYMRITNTSGGPIVIPQWGLYVEETGDFQKSWGGPGGGEPLTIPSGGVMDWMDHINQFTLGAGKFKVWMRACFQDGYCVNLAGPVQIDIG
jgi:hypothetical protein